MFKLAHWPVVDASIQAAGVGVMEEMMTGTKPIIGRTGAVAGSGSEGAPNAAGGALVVSFEFFRVNFVKNIN